MPSPCRFLLILTLLLGAAGHTAAQNKEDSGARFPATGQKQSYAAARPGSTGPVTVPDDGATQAGAPLRLRDNGDGTVTDLNTQLVWEKKCSGCDGPHDSRLRLRWSGDGTETTVWDWLDELNGKGGTPFAGHDDWRLPHVKELVSLVDFGRVDPAVDPVLHREVCWSGCTELTSDECSCTAFGEYWTSTTFSDFPAHAITVDFGSGFVDDRLKTNRHFVRAVRGGR